MVKAAQTLSMDRLTTINKRWAILLLLLLCAIGLGVLLLPEPQLPPFQAQTTQGQRFSRLDATNITRINVNLPQGSEQHLKRVLQLQRRDQTWWITQPVEFPANPIQVKKLISVLYEASHQQFEIKANELSQYGLERPQMLLEFNDEPVRVGNNDPVYQQRYILHQDKIYLINDTPALWMNKSADAFAQPALLPETGAIQSIRLPLFTVLREKGAWRLTANPQGNSRSGVSMELTAITSKLSTDVLAAYVDEWRYGQALSVQFNNAIATPKDSPQIIVQQQGREQAHIFYLDTHNQTLRRDKPNTTYQLAPETYRTLTQPTFLKHLLPDSGH
ncbi:MAG: DUF4340 domain-containing protein [Gammaproteobacteria bacterium]|nr:DUF4340 domain-containing protein [Gammaproteobacteria bacterium]MDH5800322.1 DUF4340 domain-containing protein [Gammaproteobacteria bacterium]